MARYFEVRIDENNEHHVTGAEYQRERSRKCSAMIQLSAETAEHAPATTSLWGHRRWSPGLGDLQLYRRIRSSTDRRMGAWMSSDNELDAMTDEQAAEHYYRHRDEIEREPGEPVDMEPARPLSLVVSVRLREGEAEQVAAASEAAGMKVSTFIRQAAVAAAARDESLDREALTRRLASVRRAVDDVEQLVQRRPSIGS